VDKGYIHRLLFLCYGVTTVGINEANIRHYIRFQEKEDDGQMKLAPSLLRANSR
jgi:hypothetical protein